MYLSVAGFGQLAGTHLVHNLCSLGERTFTVLNDFVFRVKSIAPC